MPQKAYFIVQHPGRAFIRRASRAEEVLLRTSAWAGKPNHSRLLDILRSRWRRCWKDTLSATVPDGSPMSSCKQCGAGMDDYTTVVADAAQFYEGVSQDEIAEALKWVTRRAKQLNVHVVTVFRGKRLRGFTSAHRCSHVRATEVWTPRQIELALQLAPSQSYFSVSGETWRQRHGVSIGGLVSKILCSVVMGASETSGRKTGNAESPLILVEKKKLRRRPSIRGRHFLVQPKCTAVTVSWQVRT